MQLVALCEQLGVSLIGSVAARRPESTEHFGTLAAADGSSLCGSRPNNRNVQPMCNGQVSADGEVGSLARADTHSERVEVMESVFVTDFFGGSLPIALAGTKWWFCLF